MRIRFDPEPDVCPTAAFEPDELAWPRVVRRAFSDPRVPHESTGVDGRGTEEVKTNDVSGRVGRGRGRLHDRARPPGVGVRFRDSGDVPRAGARPACRSRRRIRSPPDERRRDGHHPRRHPEREGAVGHRRDQGAGGTRRGDHPPGLGRRRSASTRWWRSASACAATRTATTTWSRRSSSGSATTSSGPRPISAWDGSRIAQPVRQAQMVNADDQHTASIRQRRELSRRLTSSLRWPARGRQATRTRCRR